MQLIGMLDSPYVRRTAISLECLGVAFAQGGATECLGATPQAHACGGIGTRLLARLLYQGMQE